MTDQRIKWSDNLRLDLYTDFRNRFGPFKNWETSKYPSSELKEEFLKFCSEFAKKATWLTYPKKAKQGDFANASAVQQQLDYAVQKPLKDSLVMNNHTKNQIAAWQACFIENFIETKCEEKKECEECIKKEEKLQSIKSVF